MQPVGVQQLGSRGRAPPGDEEGPLATVGAGRVLPLGLDAIPEEMDVGSHRQAGGRQDVVVQAACAGGDVGDGERLADVACTGKWRQRESIVQLIIMVCVDQLCICALNPHQSARPQRDDSRSARPL